MKRRGNNIIETILFAVIFLVLVQTFLEEFAVLAGWTWEARKVLIVTGFFFDLFFTLEFLIRFYYALARREGKLYLLHQKGWIDLVASVPLLMFNSGPSLFAVIAGSMGIAGIGGLLNVLKVIKVVRIARILRLLRVLKVFKQIKFVDSTMAQRHVSRIVSTIVAAIILPVMIFSFVFSIINWGDLEDLHKSRSESLIAFMETQEPAVVWDYCQQEKSFLLVKREGKVIFSRYEDQDYQRYFAPTDYEYRASGDYEIFLDGRGLEKQKARENMLIFMTVVFVLMALLIFYSPHFAMTVTDPITVMMKGMQESSYNLEVKIPPLYGKDDVYRLARSYNDTFLPMKARDAMDSEEMVDLQVDDLDSLFEGMGEEEDPS